MYKKALSRISALLLLLPALLLVSACDEQASGPHREPMLSVRPVEGFVPELGLPADLSYAPVKTTTNEQGSYFEGTYIAAAPTPGVEVKLVVSNESDIKIPLLVLNVYIEDPRKIFLFNVANQAAFGGDVFNVPVPAMLDDTHPVFDANPYAGYIGYFAVKPLAAGESYEFRAILAAVEGAVMHIEAVGLFDHEETEENEGLEYWGVPIPRSGTTILVTKAASAVAGPSVSSVASQLQQPAPNMKLFRTAKEAAQSLR